MCTNITFKIITNKKKKIKNCDTSGNHISTYITLLAYF